MKNRGRDLCTQALWFLCAIVLGGSAVLLPGAEDGLRKLLAPAAILAMHSFSLAVSRLTSLPARQEGTQGPLIDAPDRVA